MLFRCLFILFIVNITNPTFQLSAQANEFIGGPGLRIPTDPVVTLHYGLSELSLKDFERPFEKPGLLEIKLGFESRKLLTNDNRIVDLMKRYISISNMSTDIGGGTATGGGSNVWRVGLASLNGYGYRLSTDSPGPAVILSHSNGLTWSNIDIDRPAIIPPNGFPPDRFDDAIRFGGMTEAEVMVQFSSSIAVNASFERSIIYERHLFWKWLGSVIIEGATQGLVDRFVDRILDSSPTAAPIVNFLLKNGLAYGVYELRKSDMNWPFDTAAPLHYDTFKVGITFFFDK